VFACTSHCIARKHVWVILFTACLLMLPGFVLGPGGHDLQCQSIWIKTFSAQFWQGDVYPRWLMDMEAGRGSPVFFYYPPLSYFITALLYPLARFADFGYLQIAASAWLSLLLSGLTFYIWMKRETANPSAALIASLLYMALPEHININFYSLLMPSTLWVYALLPLVFMAARQTMTEREFGVIYLAAALCLLLLCNIPQMAIWSVLAIAYSLLYIRKDSAFWQLGKLAGAVALALGLAAFYLVPMLFYKDFVNAAWQKDTVQLGDTTIDKSQYIFFIGKGANLNLLLTAFFAFTLVALFLYCKKAAPSRDQKFFTVIAILALLFMDPDTMAIWKLLPIYIIQFAERLFTVTSLSLCVLAALTYPLTRKWSYGILAVCMAITAVWPQASRTTMEKIKDVDPQVYRQIALDIDQFPDYLTTPDLYTLYNSYGYEYNVKDGPGSAHLVPMEVAQYHEQVYVTLGDAQVTVRQWRPRHILLHYKATQDSTLLIRQFMFPGFQAFVNGQEIDLARDHHNGQILMQVPAGEADITLTLTALVPETLGKGISLLAVAIALLLWLLQRRRQSAAA
jgi:uncharacterized membrane protein